MYLDESMPCKYPTAKKPCRRLVLQETTALGCRSTIKTQDARNNRILFVNWLFENEAVLDLTCKRIREDAVIPCVAMNCDCTIFRGRHGSGNRFPAC